jgi:ribosomal protein S18 acetylase RimI-like enzyme
MLIKQVVEFDDDLLAAVRVLIPQLNPELPIPSEECLREQLSSANSLLFVAREGEKIVGMLTLVIYQTPAMRHARIESVVVDQDFQGRGIGKGLVREALALAEGRKVQLVELTSSPKRIAANELYRKMGFDKYETNNYHCHLRRSA